MVEIDFDKLRRFSLAVALVIVTYSVAGINLDPNSGISIVGLAFKVSKPELLPIGFIIASLYAIVRFYYYGFMLKKSPFRVRRDIIDGLNVYEPKYVPGSKVWIYFGPTEFETTIDYAEREKAEKYILNLPEAFPKFAGAKVTAKVISSNFTGEDGNIHIRYAAKIKIPKRCRFAAIIQDVDFATPIWLNIIALVVFFYTR